MPTAEEFDEFYVSTRRGLVLQTFALTGDLGASRRAVRDAYVAARHHWDKIGHLEDPESWVRPRAWSAAQRRHTVRPWHRERHIGAEQAATLEALHELPDAQRRALVLTHLSDLARPAAARELGVPLAKVDQDLQAATATVAATLDRSPGEIPALLGELGSAADKVKLPRPTVVRRHGLRRRRNHAIVGSLGAAALTVAAGAFVAVGTPAATPINPADLVSPQMLLTQAQIDRLSSKPWLAVRPSDGKPDDNTMGSGINTPCQETRFADEAGLKTWVRKYVTSGGSPTKLVQTVEVSNSPGSASKAYQTILGWYAGCTAVRIRILDAFRVDGVGDTAQVLRLRITGRPNRSFAVGIARSGALTTSTVLETSTSTSADVETMAQTLAASVRNLCSSPVAGRCVSTVKPVPAALPLSGETPGMLASPDLPAIPDVTFTWLGTDPQDARVNLAATTCDNANFVSAGAGKPVMRSYLFPEADLPKQFGITETIGKFSSPKVAVAFTDRIIARLRACPEVELSSTVTQGFVLRGKADGTTVALWRLQNEVAQGRPAANYWTGITRVGSYVAQVTFTPTPQYDVNRDTFKALVVRARDRLYELKQ